MTTDPAEGAGAARRVRVTIRGAVQGVGFRPFVYRRALELALAGWVINDTGGVVVEVEGPAAALERFLERLPAEQPPRALIHSLETAWLAPRGATGFTIRHSDAQGPKTVLVLPDIATCADCLAEVRDPANRRCGYPFTNCTNCGPRFTIVTALPYDRPNTTMRDFALCPACGAEYADPTNRRFHAQPNACPVCGPRLALWAAAPEALAVDAAALAQAAAALRAGQIVAVKGLGGFHLMVAAGDAAAVDRLRARKPRRDKPFALMLRDLAQARALCALPPAAESLLTGPEAPIVLLRRRDPPAADAPPVAANVAPGIPDLGVMLPATPLHHLLLAAVGDPLVATSGNLSDEPICTDEREAVARLGGVADLFLVHDRPIARHVDDSVAWVLEGAPRLLRRARGYAPLPVRLARPAPVVLAVGAHLKNTVALSVGAQVFISQHIGDLETPEAMGAFERVIADFLRLYAAAPVAIAHDLHPDYLSTKWAQGAGESRLLPELRTAQRIPVQHHHAHLAACLAENGADGPALGLIWDGVGYGPDGTVWGGECLLGDAAGYSRVAHLRPFGLPGGAAAVREPRRVALALLWEYAGAAALEWTDLAPLQALTPAEARLLGRMLERGVNTPRTTSAGRLFDGVAALLGLHQQVSYEGQAAMALEFAADPAERGAYPLPLVAGPAGAALLDWRPTLEALLADRRRGVARGTMAARFHNGLVAAMLAVAQHTGVAQVALSGGCFQNRLLTERAVARLRDAGFAVLLHRHVPPNDGGISLGQVAAAAARLAAAGG